MTPRMDDKLNQMVDSRTVLFVLLSVLTLPNKFKSLRVVSPTLNGNDSLFLSLFLFTKKKNVNEQWPNLGVEVSTRRVFCVCSCIAARRNSNSPKLSFHLKFSNWKIIKGFLSFGTVGYVELEIF